MKRYFLITLIDGRTFERDINGIPGLSLGLKQNSPELINLANSLACQGIIEDKEAKQLKVIAPSQIKCVEIVFEEGNNLKLI